MPVFRQLRPLRGVTPKRYGRPDLRDRDIGRYSKTQMSLQFDWDAALYLFACGMRDLGYPLSSEQQERIADHC